MYTMKDIRRAIEDNACVARGQAYVRERRVTGVTVSGAVVFRYEGSVRGHGETYRTMFGYDTRQESFTQCSCTCPAFERAAFGCKHVAALMIYVLEDDQVRRRDLARLEEQRREEERRLEAWRQ